MDIENYNKAKIIVEKIEQENKYLSYLNTCKEKMQSNQHNWAENISIQLLSSHCYVNANDLYGFIDTQIEKINDKINDLQIDLENL